MADRRNRVLGILTRTIWILAAAAFGFICVNGLFVSCRIDTLFSETNNEHVEFIRNSPVLLLLCLAAVLAVLSAFSSVRVSERAPRIGRICLAVFGFCSALLWIRESAPVPYADSQFCLEIASAAASGKQMVLSDLSYLRLYPFQAGFVLYAELVHRLLGASALQGMWFLNACWLVLFDLAVTGISDVLFENARVTLLTEILLALFAQPVFLTVFLYGTIPGSAVGAVAALALIRYLKNGKSGWGFGAAFLTGLAVLLKLNLAVPAVAGCIVLAFRLIRKPAWQTAAVLAAMVLCTVFLPELAKIRYESLCGASLGAGFPRSGHLLMGLSESSMCSGWHNANVPLVFVNSGYDAGAANAAFFAEIGETVRHFLSRPRYLVSFFYHKITSQWNTPSFQGIWSAAVSHDPERAGAFARSLFYGPASETAERYFLGIAVTVYAGFAGFLAGGVRRRETDGAMTLLPLTLLGFFLYYGLFEAKAQYVILAVPTMIPLAACFWTRASDRLRSGIRKAGGAR